MARPAKAGFLLTLENDPFYFEASRQQRCTHLESRRERGVSRNVTERMCRIHDEVPENCDAFGTAAHARAIAGTFGRLHDLSGAFLQPTPQISERYWKRIRQGSRTRLWRRVA